MSAFGLILLSAAALVQAIATPAASAPDMAAQPAISAEDIASAPVVIQPAEPVTFKGGSTAALHDQREYAGKALAFAPSVQAVNAVNKIASHTGVIQNFVIQPAAVANAVAVFDGRQRIILYNPDFLSLIDNTVDHNWGVVGILAHEVGHHLQGHTLSLTPSARRNELEADHFSGYVLYRMGASLDDALTTINAIGVATETPTHPGKAERIQAITAGWNDARRMSMSTVPPAINPQFAPGDMPVRQSAFQDVPDSAPDAMSFTGRIRLEQNMSAEYYVTKSNNLLWRDRSGAYQIVGRKRPTRSPQFAWSLETANAIYDVGFDGAVSVVLPNGETSRVGVAIAP